MTKLTAVLLAILLLLPAACAAASAVVTSTDLIERAAALDGQEVEFSGEVIGDIMARGEHTWLNVSDGVNAVGIWADTEAVKDITLPGRYGVHGDEVRVTGMFHRACREHGGDLDIHATRVRLIAKGYPVTHTLSPVRLVIAIVLALACAGLLVWVAIRRRRL